MREQLRQCLHSKLKQFNRGGVYFENLKKGGGVIRGGRLIEVI